MEEFRLIAPSPLLAPYVRHYWLLKAVGDGDSLARTVPTGMTNLMFHRGNRMFSVQEGVYHSRAFVNGHDRTFADLRYEGQVNMISVVFHPAGLRAFFPLPVDRLAGLRLTAGDLEDREFARLEQSLASTESDDACILLIEQFLLKRLTQLAAHNLKRIEASIRLINTGSADVTSLADTACLSTKQFNRVFAEYVGSNPKEFMRTIRFQRALHLLANRPQTPLTALAYECGYYDQAHMIKEFKALSGYTPGEYLATCQPYSDYFG